MLYACGHLLFKLERYAKAAEVFNRVLKLRHRHAAAGVGLAWSMYHLGNKRQALEELKSVRWWAEKAGIYQLGLALQHLGHYYLLEANYHRAISYLRQAIKTNPVHYGPYLELGRALVAIHGYGDALEAFELARERLPGNVTDESLKELDDLIALAQSQLDASA